MKNISQLWGKFYNVWCSATLKSTYKNVCLVARKCLGFRLTEEGIKPGTDKLKAVKNAPPPSNVHEVRQFLGLCNF
jgi:hypothetical protein